MRRRRRQPQDDELHNKERWLISYADFITLLFAFFVVMYSVSSVNEGKYKVLSHTLTGVFNAPPRSVIPIAVGEYDPKAVRNVGEDVIPPAVTEAPRNANADIEARSEALTSIADRLALEFDELINEGVVTLETSDEWIELSLRNNLLFSSGEAEPKFEAFAIIEKIAEVLGGHDNAVRVEGFTDNLPIRTGQFPSNWELSTARAAAVIRVLNAEGIDPQRLAAVGYGEFQPVARNDTPAGRNRNRRVVLLISRDASIRGAMR
ncbi:MAG: flagellar motor protein MotD [Oleiphilaceae bacterium]|nr:flagellar motor protein MotD [Oleiphilaceae bacterium]